MAVPSVDTFNVCSEFPVEVTRRLRAEQSSPAGSLQRRRVWHRPIRTFTLRWSDASDGIRVRLQMLWDNTSRGVLPMDWDPFGTGAFQVRFAENGLRIVYREYGRIDAQVTLEELP